jgi:hypothetical protein
MEGIEESLTETLGKVIKIINTVDDRYRDAAFPIILQALVEPSRTREVDIQAARHPQTTEEHKLLPGMTVNEFFRKAKPSTHLARFICVGYYLLHSGKSEQFTIGDILEIYGKLRVPKPKNPSDVMSQCVKKAYIVDGEATGDKQKMWVITPEGEKFVEGLLNDNSTNSNGTSR